MKAAPPRKDGISKVTGMSLYVDDIQFPQMIYGVTVRSDIPRGRIKAIHFDPGTSDIGGEIPWNEIHVVTAKDIVEGGAKNFVAHILPDQPCLALEEIRHPEEPVVLLAHPDRMLLERARRHVRIETEALPPVLTIMDSLLQKEVIWGKDNVFKDILIEKGDVTTTLQKFKTEKSGNVLIEGEYLTGAQEQLYIEPNGMIAHYDHAEGGITVWGSMQCPYYVHHALTEMFQMPAEKVRVVQTETGGGFGGKEDYPSIIACHSALLSWKAKAPVKMIYDRAEDMAATTKRHPSFSRHRTLVSNEGKLLAMDIEFYLDGGAYATLSSVVLSRGAIHAGGPYLCPNIKISAKALATNTPPNGAFRGFGAPQSLFAMERHMDRIARRLGMDPIELRKKNFLHKGDATATGQVIRENNDLEGLLETALKESSFKAKRDEYNLHNKNPHTKTRKGIGLATFMHGAGFTGSGEKAVASVVAVELAASSKLRVLVSSTEIGQGARTVFAKIISDALHIPYEDVEVAQPDTAEVPNSGPTVASRTTMIVGKLVESAAIGIKQTLIQEGLLKPSYTAPEFKAASLAYLAKRGPLKIFTQYKQPEYIRWDDQTYKGDAYGTFAWAVYVADVTVDLTTYETTVSHFTTVQEVGKVIHPVLAAGQIEGGVVQGIGYSLYEEVVQEDGHMANNRMTNYIIPTSKDVPSIRVIFAENPYENGPQGAKGIGELPLDGVAPAILNAVHFATNVPVNQIPLLPETLLRSFDQGLEVPKEFQ